MANTKTVSVLVSEGLLADAAALALAEKRSRNYILARWMAMGKWAETGMVGSNPEVRVGVESRFAKILRGGDEAQDKKLRRVGAVVEAQDVGMVAGSPGPGFGEVPEKSLANIAEEHRGNVPDEAVGFIEAMRKKVEAFTGADPETIKAAQPTVQKKKAQTKKNASGVAPVAGPGFREETPFVYDRPGTLPPGDIAPGQSVTPFHMNQQQLKPAHDTENCHVYGCLMCKAAKEGK